MTGFRIYHSFLAVILISILVNVFFPSYGFNFFAPFLTTVYYAFPLSKALWIAAGAGYTLDLMSSEFKFGLSALSFVLTTSTLYQQKRHFFEDKALAFSLYTILISLTSRILQILFIHLFDRGISFSFLMFLNNIIIMPILDGGYALLWFMIGMELNKQFNKFQKKFRSS